MLNVLRYPIAAAATILSTAFTPLHNAASTASNIPGKIISNNTVKAAEEGSTSNTSLASKYESWHLDRAGISKQLFNYAVKGYTRLLQKKLIRKQEVISIADLGQQSDQKRFYIIDLLTGKVLFQTLVAHGKNSGQQWAKSFSNKVSSLETSLGFYITSQTYQGQHGYSLKLNGIEKGFNDNAAKRAIVLHGAEYVSESFIAQNGYLGRSHGCPAVPAELSKQIIDEIKDGSCLFVYAPVKKYLTQSALLKR
jgi:L,D-transpeptidase catalytic domain